MAKWYFLRKTCGWGYLMHEVHVVVLAGKLSWKSKGLLR